MSGYDYVIVGAGSAGCALAGRLSEDPACRVLLLEAGDPATGWQRDMPAALFKMMTARPDLNWNFTSEPEPALGGRRIALPRGKTLGGSSQINGLVYTRGHWRDYDEWARLGATGWSYREVLPYFKRMECSWAGDTEYRGGRGPVGVSAPRHEALMFEVYREAAAQAGHVVTEDYHARVAEGYTPVELTTRGGRRSSSFKAYLSGVLRQRPNLQVSSSVHARRIVVEHGRAVGVELLRHGVAETVRAEREVVLCCGAYGSPQLLMFSGIGPADELRRHGIGVVQDLPGVGRQLSEHPLVWLHFATRHAPVLDRLRWDKAALSALQWRFTGRGLFATNCCAGHVFARTEPSEDRPDVELSCFAIDKNARPWFPLLAPRPEPGIGLMIQMVRPQSRGRVTLAGSDPLAPPRVHLNLLGEEADMARVLGGMRLGRELFSQPALQALGMREDVPGLARRSAAELAEFVRRTCMISHHAAGTCCMGGHGMAVVDPALRVRGIEGLRVADASVMPIVPGANTNAAAMMIGEKAADLVRGLPALPPGVAGQDAQGLRDAAARAVAGPAAAEAALP